MFKSFIYKQSQILLRIVCIDIIMWNMNSVIVLNDYLPY